MEYFLINLLLHYHSYTMISTQYLITQFSIEDDGIELLSSKGGLPHLHWFLIHGQLKVLLILHGFGDTHGKVTTGDCDSASDFIHISAYINNKRLL
jgi:hypothetical protein